MKEKFFISIGNMVDLTEIEKRMARFVTEGVSSKNNNEQYQQWNVRLTERDGKFVCHLPPANVLETCTMVLVHLNVFLFENILSDE